ncbi:hypothetical protein LQZ19_08215 [Treponema primitia]|uniref:hypothetical protein n=1 Tax=Treponema primitia TaxID=88058 RepID=UPI003980973F
MDINTIIDFIKEVEKDNANKYNNGQCEERQISGVFIDILKTIMDRMDFTEYLKQPPYSVGAECRNISDDVNPIYKMTYGARILSDKAIVRNGFNEIFALPGSTLIQLNVGFSITIQAESMYVCGGVLNDDTLLGFLHDYIQEHESEYTTIVESFDSGVIIDKENCTVKQYLEKDVLSSPELFVEKIVWIFQSMKPFIDFITDSVKGYTKEFQDYLLDLPDIYKK